MKLYYLGPEGTFSHIIAGFLCPAAVVEPRRSFREIVESVIADRAFGVLPIENSSTSDIHETIDLILNHDLRIVAEGYLNVRLQLVGLKSAVPAGVTTVLSHPKALAQCSRFISTGKLSTEETTSTGAAQAEVLKRGDPTCAAIGGGELLDPQALAIIQSNIGDFGRNQTRFVVVSKSQDPIAKQEPNKLSLSFKIPHQPGSLARILARFAEQKLNLTKIESRPIPGTDWEYNFWVDLECQNINQAIELAQRETMACKVIGSYVRGLAYDT